MKAKIIAGCLAVLLCLSGAVDIGGPVLEAAPADQKITINLASRILTLYQAGKKKYMFHIGAGKVETPTPVGTFSILSMEENPEWVDPKDTKKRVESGEDNPLGYRWMEFKDVTYGIHGTNKPESIGGYVSNGCIRLLEKDVEQLYDAVEIGTPVEVSYDRVVVEQIADGTVVYYIYPDGYGRQPLDVSDVRRALEKYGVESLLSDGEIEEKIDNSDGEPTFLGRPFRVEVDDRWISGRAISMGEALYVPALPLSVVTKTEIVWDMLENQVRTSYGEAEGFSFGGKLYIDAREIERLFRLEGGLNEAEGVLRLRSKAAVPVVTATGRVVPPELSVKVSENTRATVPDAASTQPAETPQGGRMTAKESKENSPAATGKTEKPSGGAGSSATRR
ncbi:MAG: L,D-transpeptidase [Schwartzia sp.]|nr:L,D-transpeptidase [Schwartzia sp. (in: firmicutes)]